MRLSRRGLVNCVALIAGLISFPVTSGFAALTEIRFCHAIPGATNLNMRLDYTNFARNVKYRKATRFKFYPEGNYLVDLTTKNEVTTVVPPAPRDFPPGMLLTVLASGSVSGQPPLDTVVIPITREFVPPLQARVVIINAIPDRPDVEVLLNGVQIDPALAFNGFTIPGNMPSGKYELEVKEGGNTILYLPKLKLRPGKTNTLVLQGTVLDIDGYPVIVKNYLSK